MSLPAGQVADPATIRGLAAEILERPEYAAARQPAELLDPFRWLLEGLRKVLELAQWFDGLRYTAPLVYGLVLGGLLLILGLLIAHIYWAVSRALRESAEAGGSSEAAAMADFSTQSRELARQGRYLEAAHRLLLAALQRSARTGLIELRPEDTNQRVCERLEDAGLPAALRQELLALILETERAWFRDREDDPALYERWSTAYGSLVEATE